MNEKQIQEVLALVDAHYNNGYVFGSDGNTDTPPPSLRPAIEAALREQQVPQPAQAEQPKAQQEPVGYNVWQCRIYVRNDIPLPRGFDAPPRSAAEHALQSAGIPYEACFSGWGNKTIEHEVAVIEDRLPAYTSAPQREPMTEAQIDEEWFYVTDLSVSAVAKARIFARAVERFHNITKDTK